MDVFAYTNAFMHTGIRVLVSGYICTMSERASGAHLWAQGCPEIFQYHVLINPTRQRLARGRCVGIAVAHCPPHVRSCPCSALAPEGPSQPPRNKRQPLAWSTRYLSVQMPGRKEGQGSVGKSRRVVPPRLHGGAVASWQGSRSSPGNLWRSRWSGHGGQHVERPCPSPHPAGCRLRYFPALPPPPVSSALSNYCVRALLV